MNDIKSLSHRQMEMQIPHSICAKVQETEYLREDKGGYRADIKETVRTKRSGDNRGPGMFRPHPYDGEYTTKLKCSAVCWVSEGKKFADDI